MRVRLHALALGAMLLAMPVAAHAYSTLYVFGDSLSDAGNLFAATHGTEPAAPYVNGEFSNGPIWVQDLSNSLGLGSVTPSTSGGNDYAYGDATTAFAATTNNVVPNLTQQVGAFLATNSNTAPSTALYTVWIGANDLFNILSSGATATVAAQDAAGAAASEATAIKDLAAAGARSFLVPLVPDLGKTPAITVLGTAAETAASQLTAYYNTSLQADLATLAGTTGNKVNFLDTYALIDKAVFNPASYGFGNVTDPCYVGPYTGGGTVCASPSQYLFWDHVHPTAAGQALVASAAFGLVPEPGSVTILGVALGGLAMARRRRRAAA